MATTEKPELPSVNQQLNVLRFGLELDKFRLDQTKAKLESSFFAKNFAALTTGAIAFAGTLVSIATLIVGHFTNLNTADLAARKDLREFVEKHISDLFGTDRTLAERDRRILEITYPHDLVSGVLTHMLADAPAQTRDIYSQAPKEGAIIKGKIGIWGGPKDASVTANEGLSIISEDQVPSFKDYFLSPEAAGAPGLARRLNPQAYYISARWNYKAFSPIFLRTHKVLVKNPLDGKEAEAQPVDWGPAEITGRVGDISPGLASFLGLREGDLAVISIPTGISK